MGKRLSKHIASFDYFDKPFIVLSTTSGSISSASFATVISSPIGIARASSIFPFLLTTGIVKRNVKKTQNKNKKHNRILRLARTKLNSIESKVSKALINNKIRH